MDWKPKTPKLLEKQVSGRKGEDARAGSGGNHRRHGQVAGEEGGEQVNEIEKLKADKTLFMERIVFLERLLEKHKIRYIQENKKEGK